MDTVKHNELKDSIKHKKEKIYSLEKIIRNLKSELKIEKVALQNICKHNYVRECTTSGCYAEYHNICTKCNHWA